MKTRPSFIANVSDLPSSRHVYAGDDEPMGAGTSLSRPLGLTRLGVHHQVLTPGSRSSYPHAEEKEEELVYVLEGTPDVWLDGELHRLRPGDAVAFPPGTGISHTFLNDTDTDVRLLVVGENDPTSRIHYPLRRAGWDKDGSRRWVDVPARELGPHDGMPRRPREEKKG